MHGDQISFFIMIKKAKLDLNNFKIIFELLIQQVSKWSMFK